MLVQRRITRSIALACATVAVAAPFAKVQSVVIAGKTHLAVGIHMDANA